MFAFCKSSIVGLSCNRFLRTRKLISLIGRGVFVYWYGPFYFGLDRSAVNKHFEPFQYHSVDLVLDSSTANHIKNGLVPSKRSRPGPTIERSDSKLVKVVTQKR
jgi:hypothetical protein